MFVYFYLLVGIPGLEPGRCPLPKSGDLPISPHPVIIEEEVGVDPNTRKGTARFQDGVAGRCN